MWNCFSANNNQRSASRGQLSPPTDTICRTISINDTAINSSEPNQQPKCRSAETQTLPFKPIFFLFVCFFLEAKRTPEPRYRGYLFRFFTNPSWEHRSASGGWGTNRSPEEATSTMWSRDNGTGLGRRSGSFEAFVAAMILQLCCNIPSCVGGSFSLMTHHKGYTKTQDSPQMKINSEIFTFFHYFLRRSAPSGAPVRLDWKRSVPSVSRIYVGARNQNGTGNKGCLYRLVLFSFTKKK